MKDRTILDNARNMLLITASSFCLSAGAATINQPGRIIQEQNLRPTAGKCCEEKSDAKEDEQRRQSSLLRLRNA